MKVSTVNNMDDRDSIIYGLDRINAYEYNNHDNEDDSDNNHSYYNRNDNNHGDDDGRN